MGYSTTPPEPSVTVVDINDLTAANAGMDVLAQDGVTLQSLPLRAKRVIVRLRSATVVYHATNLRLRTLTRAQDGLIAYVAFGPQATGMVEGLQVRPGMLVVGEPGTAAGFVVDPGYESIALLVPPDVLREHLVSRQREDEFRLPRGIEVLHTDPVRASRLFRWGKRLTTIASKKPALFDDGRLESDAAQVDLLEALLTAIRSADTVKPLGTDITRRTHSRIVRLAEDYALSRIGERVHVSDLCRIVDVSERTLECAFKEVTKLSPTAYLIRLRLHRAHAALLAAEPGSIQVSSVAIKCGFWHFGEFSRAYKKCFGEPPSLTLRRAPSRKTGRLASSGSTP